MKNFILNLFFFIVPVFVFAQNGVDLCNQDEGQLKYYKGFYQRTQYISSSTYNAKMGDPGYRSAFYWLALPNHDDVTTARTFSVNACTYRGSLYLGEGSSCTGINQLDANSSCSSAPGVRTYHGGIPADKTYVIEFNTKGRGGIDEDGAEHLIWSWEFNGPEACDTPSITEVAVDHTTNNATISFTERDGSAPSGTYEVYLLSEHDETEYVDLPVLGNPTKTVTSSPFVLTNLTPNTNYRLWISKFCDGINSMGSGFATDDASYIDTTDQGATVGFTVCDAISLDVGVKANPYDQYLGSSATTETDEPTATCHSGFAYQSMWFTFVAPQSGNVRISTDTEKQGIKTTEIALYAAPSSCSDLTTFGTALACDTDSGVYGDGNLSVIEHTGLTAGDTYYVQVLAFESGAFGIEVLEQVGDEATEAPELEVDASVVDYNIYDATLSSVTTNCSITATKDAFIKFTAPSSGDLTLELLTNTEVAAYLELFEYNSSNVLTSLGVCSSGTLNIDIAQQSSSSRQFQTRATTPKLTPSGTYYIRVVQESGKSFDSFSLSATNATLTTDRVVLDQILIYPNPAKGKLFFTQPERIVEARIFDLTGKQHTAGKPTNGTLDISHLDAGIYMLQLETTAGKTVQKIIKE